MGLPAWTLELMGWLHRQVRPLLRPAAYRLQARREQAFLACRLVGQSPVHGLMDGWLQYSSQHVIAVRQGLESD